MARSKTIPLFVFLFIVPTVTPQVQHWQPRPYVQYQHQYPPQQNIYNNYGQHYGDNENHEDKKDEEITHTLTWEVKSRDKVKRRPDEECRPFPGAPVCSDGMGGSSNCPDCIIKVSDIEVWTQHNNEEFGTVDLKCNNFCVSSQIGAVAQLKCTFSFITNHGDFELEGIVFISGVTKTALQNNGGGCRDQDGKRGDYTMAFLNGGAEIVEEDSDRNINHVEVHSFYARIGCPFTGPLGAFVCRSDTPLIGEYTMVITIEKEEEKESYVDTAHEYPQTSYNYAPFVHHTTHGYNNNGYYGYNNGDMQQAQYVQQPYHTGYYAPPPQTYYVPQQQPPPPAYGYQSQQYRHYN